MLVAEVAIADIVVLSFFWLIIRLEIYLPSERDTFWYRNCRILFSGLPSGGVFGIVWQALYICFTISAYLVWLDLWYDNSTVATLNDDENKRFVMMQVCLLVLFVNIYVNKAWTLIFFRSKQYLTSLIVIVFLFVTVVPVIVMLFYLKFYWSASLLIPYALWLCYAFYLNWVFHVEKKTVNKIWNNLVAEHDELKIYDDDSKIAKKNWKIEKNVLKKNQNQ